MTLKLLPKRHFLWLYKCLVLMASLEYTVWYISSPFTIENETSRLPLDDSSTGRGLSFRIRWSELRVSHVIMYSSALKFIEHVYFSYSAIMIWAWFVLRNAMMYSSIVLQLAVIATAYWIVTALRMLVMTVSNRSKVCRILLIKKCWHFNIKFSMSMPYWLSRRLQWLRKSNLFLQCMF